MDILGVILAGGLGKRLEPLTCVTNKHLLPVYDRPMIQYPLAKMSEAGLSDVMIVCGETSRVDFERLLGDGSRFGLKKLEYTTQLGEDGIAAALALAEEYADGRKVCVVLGDNLFEDNLKPEVDKYMAQPDGARILLKEVPDPQRFGVPAINDGKIIRIDEKPQSPASKYAVVGIYFYDNKVFDIIRTLEPSARGEYEITDVSNAYINDNSLTYGILEGWWSDCGTFESLYRASRLVRDHRRSQNGGAF